MSETCLDKYQIQYQNESGAFPQISLTRDKASEKLAKEPKAQAVTFNGRKISAEHKHYIRQYGECLVRLPVLEKELEKLELAVKKRSRGTQR